MGHLTAILSVDDKYIVHIDLRTNQSVEEAPTSLKDSDHNWGKLLIALESFLGLVVCANEVGSSH